MIPKKKLRIGDLLVEHKVISENQLQTALSEQKKAGRKLGRMLIDLGFLSEDQLLEFLSRQLQVPFIDLHHYRYKAETVRLVPETLARRYRAIALDDSQESVLVGMADPTDIFAFDELSKVLKRPIRQAVVRESDLLRTIDSVYRRTEEISSLAEELSEELSETDFDLEQLGQTDDLSEAPVVKLLQSIFEDAVQIGASDIHIEPDEAVLRIRQRIDGVLQEQVMKEKRIANALVSRLKLMGGLEYLGTAPAPGRPLQYPRQGAQHRCAPLDHAHSVRRIGGHAPARPERRSAGFGGGRHALGSPPALSAQRPQTPRHGAGHRSHRFR